MKFWRPPRVSQTPSSGWSQCSHSQSAIWDELCPTGVADPDPVLVGQPDRVQHLPVDVELELVGGAVADPDRPGAGVALEVVKGLLVEVGGAVDPVHDLQGSGSLAGLLAHPVAEPAHERRGLVGEPESEQRMDREGGVPDPGVAVVPVAFAADLLREAGGGCGHEGAGGGVGHQLERDRRAGDHLAPAAAVGRAGQPTPPEPGGVVEHGQQFLARSAPRWVLGGRLQDHPVHLPGLQGRWWPARRRRDVPGRRVRAG